MVDPNVLDAFVHVIDFEMFVWAGVEPARDILAEEGSTEAFMLARWHGHSACAGEDDVGIWFFLWSDSFDGTPSDWGKSW